MCESQKTKLQFPLANDQKGCLTCGKDPNGAFACFSGGALLKARRSSKSAGPDTRMLGFAHLVWHGRDDYPEGESDVYTSMDLVEDGDSGQFELVFCSFTCLRAFFNQCVDELEDRVIEERVKKDRLAR